MKLLEPCVFSVERTGWYCGNVVIARILYALRVLGNINIGAGSAWGVRCVGLRVPRLIMLRLCQIQPRISTTLPIGVRFHSSALCAQLLVVVCTNVRIAAKLLAKTVCVVMCGSVVFGIGVSDGGSLTKCSHRQGASLQRLGSLQPWRKSVPTHTHTP